MCLTVLDLACIQKWCDEHDSHALVSYGFKPGENPKYVITITKESTAQVYSRFITVEEIQKTPFGVSMVINNVLKEAEKEFS